MFVIMYIDGYYPDSMTDYKYFLTKEDAIAHFKTKTIRDQNDSDNLVDEKGNTLVGEPKTYNNYVLSEIYLYKTK